MSSSFTLLSALFSANAAQVHGMCTGAFQGVCVEARPTEAVLLLIIGGLT